MNNEVLRTEVVKSLPRNLRFGTSTWTYPGWKGLIYHSNYSSDKAFRAESLREYAACPLFSTVGIDRTFYSPATEELLYGYAELVPEGFEWVSKVWERLTIPKYPSHPRYGKQAGKVNPDFLSGELLLNEVLPAYTAEEIRKRTGPFVFQFPTIAKTVMAETEFLEKLHTFLSMLPNTFRFATEVRNPEFLNARYFELLNETGVTHCFNHWNYMPALKLQMKKAAEVGSLSAPFFVARILTPHGMSYQQAVKMFEPYDSIKKPNPEMREDVVRLALRALKREIPAFVIVNNRVEGNSPLTINAIQEMLLAQI